MNLRIAILWLHVFGGAIWIGASASFAIAGLALRAGSREQRDFATRVASKINRLNIAAAGLVLATGTVNFALAGIARRFHFAPAFSAVLGAKILLFIAMTALLARAIRIDAVTRAVLARGRGDAVAGAMSRMTRSHGAIVALGAIALVLGIWLSGT